VLNDAKDVQFAQSAQDAIVNGMVLPSGIRIPVSGGEWRITGKDILLK
jgi:hypothetical protein